MRLRALTLGELEALHRTRMGRDFPPEELKPFAAMQTLYEAGAYHPMGAWEGEDMVGYALLWESPGTGYLLLDYLGVEASRRNAGLGGEILRLLQGSFRDRKGILVESEAPEGDGRDVLRQRRMGFYRRNGFAFLPYTCVLFGVHYAVALCPPAEAGGEEAVMEAHRQVYRAQLAPWAYEKFVEIPRDPQRAAAPLSWPKRRRGRARCCGCRTGEKDGASGRAGRSSPCS